MNTILFDLDGTLLPMDQEVFVAGYFSELAKKFVPMGLDKTVLTRTVWAGTKAMMQNDGCVTNEKRFWETFTSLMGPDISALTPHFDSFYENEFNQAKHTTGFTPLARACTQLLKEKGYRLIAATNPIFPKAATYNRIRWAGIDPAVFDHITTYETCHFCKPSLDYYKEILQTAGKRPGDCLMVGNDVKEDMCVSALGVDTYLVKDCLINSENMDITPYKQGSLAEFQAFAQALPPVNVSNKRGKKHEI